MGVRKPGTGEEENPLKRGGHGAGRAKVELAGRKTGDEMMRANYLRMVLFVSIA
jgi:hypothetical protein